MGIRVEWYKTTPPVLVYVVDYRWTWEDFDQARTTANRMMDEVDATTVPTIIDMTKSQLFPQNVLSRFQRRRSSNPKIGMTIFVGINRFAKVLFDIISMANPDRMKTIRIVSTMADADKIIETLQNSVS